MTRPPRRKQTLHIVIEENEKMAAMKRLLEEKDETIAQRDAEITRIGMKYGGQVGINAELRDQLRELGAKPCR